MKCHVNIQRTLRLVNLLNRNYCYLLVTSAHLVLFNFSALLAVLLFNLAELMMKACIELLIKIHVINFCRSNLSFITHDCGSQAGSVSSEFRARRYSMERACLPGIFAVKCC